MDADVIVVGAGPTGLMLASELRLAGVRPLVLERQPVPREIPKANGLGGQVLELLRSRGVLDRFEAASTNRHPGLRFPFGGVQLDLTDVADPPLHGMALPQPVLERLLAERAEELGAEIRRGHEVVGLSQDGAAVTVEVRGPDGPYRLTAPYLAGCDGGHSRVRELAGIPFPGTTYPEVNRVAQFTIPDTVNLVDGGLDVPGLGRLEPGFTRTERGVFAFGSLSPELLMLNTVEDEATEYDDDVPMDLAELQASIRRVLGADLALGEPHRLSRWQFQARHAERYREGRILLAGDAARLLPATGVAISGGMLDAANLAWKLAAAIGGWAPEGLLDTYNDERRAAGAHALLQAQAQVALRRGHDAAADALRELLQALLADEQPARRLGAWIAGADVRYAPPPDGAEGKHHALVGTFAPDLVLGASGVADLLHGARPVLLILGDRSVLREAARGWEDRVAVHTAAGTGDRPADALLIRPDAHVAWAAATGEPADAAARALRDALHHWFGAPMSLPATPRPVA